MLQLGWFSTGRGEGSRGLLRLVQERILAGDLKARIQFVFSNRDPGEHEGSDQFFALVHRYGLPLIHLSSKRFRRQAGGGSHQQHRLTYDREVIQLLELYKPDLCVLAGYMLIVGPELCRRYPMLNLHPALPDGPTGTWQEVIWELIHQRAPKTGAMVHLATEEVDRGPVITYHTIDLQSEAFAQEWHRVEGLSVEELQARYGEALPLFRHIRQEGLRREGLLLLETLRALAKGELRIAGPRVVTQTGAPVTGLCLNAQIEEALGRP